MARKRASGMTVAGALKKLNVAKRQLVRAHRMEIRKAKAGSSRVAGGVRRRRQRAAPRRRAGGSRVAGAWYHKAGRHIAKAPGRAGKFVLKHTVGRMGKALKGAWKRKR